MSGVLVHTVLSGAKVHAAVPAVATQPTLHSLTGHVEIPRNSDAVALAPALSLVDRCVKPVPGLPGLAFPHNASIVVPPWAMSLAVGV
jgi:hypothetical protein